MSIAIGKRSYNRPRITLTQIINPHIESKGRRPVLGPRTSVAQLTREDAVLQLEHMTPEEISLRQQHAKLLSSNPQILSIFNQLYALYRDMTKRYGNGSIDIASIFARCRGLAGVKIRQLEENLLQYYANVRCFDAFLRFDGDLDLMEQFLYPDSQIPLEVEIQGSPKKQGPVREALGLIKRVDPEGYRRFARHTGKIVIGNLKGGDGYTVSGPSIAPGVIHVRPFSQKAKTELARVLMHEGEHVRQGHLVELLMVMGEYGELDGLEQGKDMPEEVKGRFVLPTPVVTIFSELRAYLQMGLFLSKLVKEDSSLDYVERYFINVELCRVITNMVYLMEFVKGRYNFNSSGKKYLEDEEKILDQLVGFVNNNEFHNFIRTRVIAKTA